MGIIKSIKKVGKQPVYNITVKKHHNFLLKNGILSKNCDSLRCFCIFYIKNPYIDRKKAMKSLHPSFLEDMDHATKEEKDYILRKYAHMEEDTEENYAD